MFSDIYSSISVFLISFFLKDSARPRQLGGFLNTSSNIKTDRNLAKLYVDPAKNLNFVSTRHKLEILAESLIHLTVMQLSASVKPSGREVSYLGTATSISWAVFKPVAKQPFRICYFSAICTLVKFDIPQSDLHCFLHLYLQYQYHYWEKVEQGNNR